MILCGYSASLAPESFPLHLTSVLCIRGTKMEELSWQQQGLPRHQLCFLGPTIRWQSRATNGCQLPPSSCVRLLEAPTLGPEAISLIPKSVSGEELPAYGAAGNEASEAIYFLTHSSRVKMKVCSVCHQVPYIDVSWDWNKERESVCLILQTPHTAVFRPANIQKSLAGYF